MNDDKIHKMVLDFFELALSSKDPKLVALRDEYIDLAFKAHQEELELRNPAFKEMMDELYEQIVPAIKTALNNLPKKQGE